MNAPGHNPLIKLRGYQSKAFWMAIRMFFLLWRRQAGKSFTLACKGLDRMMERRDHTCIFGSASIKLGTEFIRKEAQVWQIVMEQYRKIAAAQELKFTSNADGLDLDALCDLFEHQKLETKIWHDRTSYSRSIVVAPNPDTAVGWTGDMFLDEVGRVPDLRDVLEAVEPFIASNPEYILWMATTPPPDDDHYSFDLFEPPVTEFEPNAEGNFYDSPAGILVHRFGIHDSQEAGVPLFHPKTGEVVTPEEHRALAFDKSGWDRNYDLRFLTGGIAAVSRAALVRSMARGDGQCLGINISEPLVA